MNLREAHYPVGVMTFRNTARLAAVISYRQSDRPISAMRVGRTYDFSGGGWIRKTIQVPRVLHNRTVVPR